MVRSFDASGRVTEDAHVYDDGSERTLSYDADGRVTQDDFAKADGTTTSTSYSYDPAGRLLQKVVTDGSGAQSSEVWQSYTAIYDTSLPGEVVDEAIYLYDDGDRTTLDYEGGVLRSRLVEDLDDSESWTTQTNTFDATGALTDTVFT
jgi:serralysin